MTESFWNKYYFSRKSPEVLVKRLPKVVRKERALALNAPWDSTAIDWLNIRVGEATPYDYDVCICCMCISLCMCIVSVAPSNSVTHSTSTSKSASSLHRHQAEQPVKPVFLLSGLQPQVIAQFLWHISCHIFRSRT